ncbi:hypothetical protein WJX72_009553 [[Myrmecia] bisecta]|uniref:Uncharacterized protein n=1 Tax=[Myrmecia] bisecta TaxID=41462 RepID=A0AAW1QG63_9CHLO
MSGDAFAQGLAHFLKDITGQRLDLGLRPVLLLTEVGHTLRGYASCLDGIGGIISEPINHDLLFLPQFPERIIEIAAFCEALPGLTCGLMAVHKAAAAAAAAATTAGPQQQLCGDSLDGMPKELRDLSKWAGVERMPGAAGPRLLFLARHERTQQLCVIMFARQ